MAGFGDKLRGEREARRRSIEEMSAATGIWQSYLEALEKEDFHALPGRAFGKLYIRAYAEALGFDPRPLIEEYDRKRAAEPEGEPSSSPVETGETRPARSAVETWRQTMMEERQKARARASLPGGEEAGGAEPLPAPAESPVADSLDAEPQDAAAVDVPSTHAPLEEQPVVAPAAFTPRAGQPGWTRAAVAALIFVGLFGAAATVYFAFLRRTVEASQLADTTAAVPAASTSEAAPVTSPASSASAAPDIARPPIEAPSLPVRRPRPRATPAPPAGPSSMSIPESAVGRRVEQRRAIEPSGSFPEGSVVWFSTRVVGASAGERIRHVWIREGRTMQSIALRIGGRDWRTHSRKTVYGAGRWAVEARDDAGRVLARAEFTCGPESS
jgi:cytoskeleton protein RodZ